MPAEIRIKRGTRAQLDAAALAGTLSAGEPYLITDEDRVAVGLTASTYQAYAKVGEGGAAPGPALLLKCTTATQTFTGSADTLVTCLDTVLLNTHSAWASNTFTVPAGWGGIYDVRLHVAALLVAQNSWLDTKARVNGVATYLGIGRYGGAVNSAQFVGGSREVLLAAGDTVQFSTPMGIANVTSYSIGCWASISYVRPS
jgi:hypothetical protein